MLPDVRQKIVDGGLGLIAGDGSRVHFKIGTSTANEKNKILVITSKDDIKSKLGNGPLADACLDSLQAGSSLIYCVPVIGEIAGTKTEAIKTGEGQATFEIEGNSNNEYDIVFKIVNPGALNEATYIYSLNGGDTFTKEKCIPITGAVELEKTGLSIKFTAASNPKESFKSEDSITFKTTAPKMSNAEVLKALDIIKKSPYVYEFIHVVGSSDETLWGALATEAENMFNKLFTPIFFLCEARELNDNELLDDYVIALKEARKKVSSYRIQVCPAKASYVDLIGRTREVNGAAIVAGTYAKAKVSQSVGEVKSFPLNGVQRLLPEGIESYIDILDEAGYVTFRQYIGLNGFYITNARMFAPATSDYQYAEILRTMNKACREVRKQALMYEQAEADPEAIDNFKESLQIPLDRMAAPIVKEIAAGEVVIPNGQDILGTSSLKVKVSIIPIGIFRNINIEMGMKNPFLK